MGDAAEKRDEWIDCKEAARVLGLKPQTVRTLVFRGKLVPDHRGGNGGLKGHRFRRATIEAFLTGGKADNQ